MWSTDGHHFGETYYLAIQQMREVFKTVMGEIHAKNTVGVENISKVITDLLFNTANKLYNLKLELEIIPPPEWLKQGDDEKKSEERKKSRERQGTVSLNLLKGFLSKNRGIEYIRLNWLDYSAILRTRIVKLKHVMNQLESNDDGSIIGLTRAALYLLPNCYTVSGGSPVGEHRLVPDFRSIRLHPHRRDNEEYRKHASVMCWIQDETSREPTPSCPRGILSRALSRASSAGLSDFKIGFEIEFCMFKQADLDNGKLVPITSNHTWSTSRAFQEKALVILEDIDKELASAGIEIEQFHSEAAQGQYELILSPLPPMLAVDSLLHAREVIQYVCAKYSYRASLIPKPFDGECGSAAHVHMSFKPVKKQWSFFAGVLDEIRAINALTLGGEMSFERVIAGFWAGGVWGCWGKQNREAPLRLVEEDKAHWEIKCVDGMANMYLAVAGIISAGSAGVINGREIYGEAVVDANNMTQEEREKRGITTPMVKSMEEALDALFEADGETPTKFSNDLSQGFAKHLAAVRRAERDHLFSRFILPTSESGDAGHRSSRLKLHVGKRRAWAAQWY
ncbi:Lengsin [Dactylellina cionopaga]|nr:Lengsin [Dactylellina cionopaga]